MKKTFSCIVVVLGLVSCQDLDEMNVNPNLPTETHPQLQLTKVQWDAFQAFGGTSPLYAQKMLVQTDGESALQYYKWDRGSFGAYSSLRDVTKMIEEAERIGDSSYIALAKFFRAYYFYNLTLTYGDIPYTDALRGESNTVYAASYDEQKAVFIGVLQELSEASALLKAENKIIAGDVIYDGDVTKWRRLINAFRLKVLMTLSRQEADNDLKVKETFAAITQEEPLMESLADNAQLEFLDQQGNRYPEFNSSGFGSGMYLDSTFIRRLQDREDPRLFVYSTQTRLGKEAGKDTDDFSSYEGGDPVAPYATVNQKAAAGKVSKVNERYYQDSTTEPRILLGYAEQQLILAEAAVRGWIPGEVKSYYDSGVKASFAFYETYAEGLSPYVDESKAGAYLAKPLNDLAQAVSQEDKIERIVMQKYLQSFLQLGWTPFYDHLRTGYPDFRRPQGVAVPYRWMYPQSEYNYNAVNVSEAIRRQFGEGNDRINQKTWWLN